jgi:hypothetical protein
MTGIFHRCEWVPAVTDVFEVRLLGGSKLAALHDAELPQKDELCGAFWGTLALRAFGIERVRDELLDQDLVAREAGSTLSHGDPYESLPPGEEPRTDYRLELPVAPDPAGAGTAASSLAQAIESCSDGRLAVVRIAGPWRAGAVERLLERTLELAPDAVLIANLRTDRLWTSKPNPVLLVAALSGAEADAPASEWNVGHFVSLGSVIRGPGGMLVGVRDTYRSLGWNGNHLQPPAALDAALERSDTLEGGVLCVCRPAEAEALTLQLRADGFELRDWDNGSVPA